MAAAVTSHANTVWRGSHPTVCESEVSEATVLQKNYLAKLWTGYTFLYNSDVCMGLLQLFSLRTSSLFCLPSKTVRDFMLPPRSR